MASLIKGPADELHQAAMFWWRYGDEWLAYASARPETQKWRQRAVSAGCVALLLVASALLLMYRHGPAVHTIRTHAAVVAPMAGSDLPAPKTAAPARSSRRSLLQADLYDETEREAEEELDMESTISLDAVVDADDWVQEMDADASQELEDELTVGVADNDWDGKEESDVDGDATGGDKGWGATQAMQMQQAEEQAKLDAAPVVTLDDSTAVVAFEELSDEDMDALTEIILEEEELERSKASAPAGDKDVYDAMPEELAEVADAAAGSTQRDDWNVAISTFVASDGEDRMDKTAWKELHEQYMDWAQVDRSIKVIFLGDSITEGWREKSGGYTAEQYKGVKQIFEAKFQSLQPENFAISGDKVMNVLWRLKHGELADALQPEAAVVTIGVNDLLDGSSPELVAQEIEALVKYLRDTRPNMGILLNGILPMNYLSESEAKLNSGPRTPSQLVYDTNQYLMRLHNRHGGMVYYVDCGYVFIENEHLIPQMYAKLKSTGSEYWDYLHLSQTGYEAWGDCMHGPLHRLLQTASLQAARNHPTA
eukprot:jgi/Chlat1/5034/Chrsp329S04916